MKFELDHIGIAVESLEKGFEFYRALGFENLEIEEVSSEKVKVGFMQMGPEVEPDVGVSRLELLEPMGEESPIAMFLQKRGPGIHHICLRVKDIHKVVDDLLSKGVQLINNEPKKGAHNCLVVFVHPKSTGGVLLELSQPIK